MARIEKFGDIEAWRREKQFAKAVYAVTSAGKFARDFDLRDQIRRSSVSIMSNIAEGFGRGGNKEFMKFLSTSKGSASEVQARAEVPMD